MVPKRYLCPICGNWHDWQSVQNLKQFQSSRNSPITLPCTAETNGRYFNSYIKYYFEYGFFKYEISKFIEGNRLVITGKYPEKYVFSNLRNNNFKKCIIYIPANWFQLGKLDFNEDKTLPFGFKF